MFVGEINNQPDGFMAAVKMVPVIKAKFELEQEVWFIQTEKVIRRSKCPNCKGKPDRLIDGKAFKCSKCDGENVRGVIERVVLNKRRLTGKIKSIRLVDNYFDGKYVSYEVDGCSEIMTEKYLTELQDDSFKYNEVVYVVFPNDVIRCRIHGNHGNRMTRVMRYSSDVIEIVPTDMVFTKKSDANKRLKLKLERANNGEAK